MKLLIRTATTTMMMMKKGEVGGLGRSDWHLKGRLASSWLHSIVQTTQTHNTTNKTQNNTHTHKQTWKFAHTLTQTHRHGANNTFKTNVAPWCYKWMGWDPGEVRCRAPFRAKKSGSVHLDGSSMYPEVWLPQFWCAAYECSTVQYKTLTRTWWGQFNFLGLTEAAQCDAVQSKDGVHCGRLHCSTVWRIALHCIAMGEGWWQLVQLTPVFSDLCNLGNMQKTWATCKTTGKHAKKYAWKLTRRCASKTFKSLLEHNKWNQMFVSLSKMWQYLFFLASRYCRT